MKYLDKRESAIIQEIQQEFIFDALEARKIMYEIMKDPLAEHRDRISVPPVIIFQHFPTMRSASHTHRHTLGEIGQQNLKKVEIQNYISDFQLVDN